MRRLVLLLLVVWTASLRAQGPRGADSLSPKAVADSLAALDQLKAGLSGDSTDAAAWYRIGMISWALADRARANPPITGLDWTRLGHQADTSLRIAAQLAPANAQYRLMVGKYLLSSGVSITRFASGGFFEGALNSAREDTNSALRAEAAVEFGRVHWRRYDALANRRLETTPGAAIRSITAATQGTSTADYVAAPTPLKAVRSALDMSTMALPDEYSGLTDYHQAETLFREAYIADPTGPRPFQQLSMLLAEKSRWSDLQLLANDRLTKTPWDPWAWMSLGLARHRQANSRAAAAAFDSALTYFDPGERAHLDRIERILRHSDVGVVTKGTASDRYATRRLYWLFADPLWSRDGNESRIEFLARVTFAELRWTVDEMGVRGVDTDRGDIFVRYGPPNLVASFGGDPSQAIADVSTVWVYNTGLMFTFSGAPTFATARVPLNDQGYVAEIEELQPVRWDNLVNYRIDSIPTQVARFRATRDSVDVYIAAEPAVARIKASSRAGSTPRADFWLLAGGTIQVRRDSATLSSPGVHAWTERVKTGDYVFRVEASADSARLSGRATAPIVAAPDPIRGFMTSGTGMSDMLLAARAVPRRRAIVQRWNDLDIAAITASIPYKGQLTLVWENYDFGVREGRAEYRVAVVVQRERSAAGRLAAKVVSNVAGVVGVDRTDDRVAIRFDRSMPHAAAIADFVTIALEETPAGPYRVTLEITDQVTGRTLSRTSNFTIAK